VPQKYVKNLNIDFFYFFRMDLAAFPTVYKRRVDAEKA